MNMTIESFFGAAEDHVKTVESLANLGVSRANEFAQFNLYSGLAAMDNLGYFFGSLIKSKDLGEVAALQMRAVLPVVESAKVYARQTVALAAATTLELDRFIEKRVYGPQSMVFDTLEKELAAAEERGFAAAGIVKDTMNVARESALSAQATIKKAMYDSLDMRPDQSKDDVTDVVAKTPRTKRPAN